MTDSLRQSTKPPRVVIVGCGFAGLWAARRLARSQADVLVLDRNNYHTFLPLLYQVAAAELEPEDIVYPVRSILRRYPNVRFLMDEVTGIDFDSRQVHTYGHVFPYDYIVLAVGSASHFYGVAGAAEHAYELKTLDQAIDLRNHILRCFEYAMYENDPEKRRQSLTFSVVGGGSTGVEFTGALAELIRGPLKKDYFALDFEHEVRLILLEAADRLMTGLPERLQRYTLKHLRRQGVDVRLQASVSQISPQAVILKDGTSIPTETVVWTAGVRGEVFAGSGALTEGRNARLKVLPTLQSPDHPEVYIAGDLAYVEQEGRPLPMVATVAIQEAEHAARNILRQAAGQELLPFYYHDPGTMVTIGRNAAVVQIKKLAFTGFIAWVLWLGVNLYRLIGFRNRLFVMINWAWDYLFYERTVRLIVPAPQAKPVQAPQTRNTDGHAHSNSPG
jgi:NADH dehydrogenase